MSRFEFVIWFGCSLHVWHMWKHVPCPTHSSKLHLLPHCSHCQHAQSKRYPSTTNKQRPRCQVGGHKRSMTGHVKFSKSSHHQESPHLKGPSTATLSGKSTTTQFSEPCHFPKQMPKTLMEAQVAKSQDAMAEKSKPSQAVNCGRQGTL